MIAAKAIALKSARSPDLRGEFDRLSPLPSRIVKNEGPLRQTDSRLLSWLVRLLRTIQRLTITPRPGQVLGIAKG
jgi:hypothetical protein